MHKVTQCDLYTKGGNMNFYCNPLRLEYRYQVIPDSTKEEFTVSREAADPTVISFRGKYYLFASMTLGVYTSVDLVTWEYHRLPENLPLYDYAPDARVVGDYVYLSASNNAHPCNFYRTKDILHGPYEEIPGTFPFWDPNLFVDDDGRLYFYWGCANDKPLYGVELNPDTMEPLGEPVGLIYGDPSEKGYERVGEDNGRYGEATFSSMPYIEGAWMDKFEGRYYLQYAAPGTEFNTYCDGVYVGDAPLGPFVPAKNNPYSLHPGSFLPGAGHGSTLVDATGNLWHASTMRISVNHMFERRVGLWPAGVDADGELFCNQRYGDWPKSVTGNAENPWKEPEWMLLSYGKHVAATSEAVGHEAAKAVDENVRTCWMAEVEDTNPALTLDLGELFDVHGIQVNFADCDVHLPEALQTIPEGKERRIIDEPIYTRFLLEASCDGVHYDVLWDQRQATTDYSHDFLPMETGRKIRYLRLSQMQLPFHQRPSVSGLRVFGLGAGALPKQATAEVTAKGDMDFEVTMSAPDAVGYNVLWGYAPEKLYHSYLTYEAHCHIGALKKHGSYYLRVDCFNENGITEGEILNIDL